MKYADVVNWLNDLKAKGKIVDWKEVQDLKNRFVINIEWLRNDGALVSENYILRIRHRNTEKEECFWVNRVPRFEEENSTFENIVNSVVERIKAKERFISIDNVHYDKRKGVIYIGAWFVSSKKPNVAILKQYIVFVDGGEYKIFINGNAGEE